MPFCWHCRSVWQMRSGVFQSAINLVEQAVEVGEPIKLVLPIIIRLISTSPKRTLGSEAGGWRLRSGQRAHRQCGRQTGRGFQEISSAAHGFCTSLNF